MHPRGLPGRPFRRHFRDSFLPGGQHAFVFPLLGPSKNFQHNFWASARRLPAPTWTEVVPERLPEASGRRFRTLPGTIFALRGSIFGPSGSVFHLSQVVFSRPWQGTFAAAPNNDHHIQLPLLLLSSASSSVPCSFSARPGGMREAMKIRRPPLAVRACLKLLS